MCAAGRITVGYVYLTEFLSKEKMLALAPIMNAAAVVSTVGGTLTFQFITKNTILFEAMALMLNLILIVLIFFFVPESPKSLIASRCFDEARDSLSYIARFNGVDQLA